MLTEPTPIVVPSTMTRVKFSTACWLIQLRLIRLVTQFARPKLLLLQTQTLIIQIFVHSVAVSGKITSANVVLVVVYTTTVPACIKLFRALVSQFRAKVHHAKISTMAAVHTRAIM